MKEIWNLMQMSFSLLGGVLGWFLGGLDGMLYALIVLVILDYITGVFCAIYEKQLSSEIGFKGLAKKVIIFMLVGIANILDTEILGQSGVLRAAVIFFYLSNEGISIIENTARMGLPIPEQLKKVLKQLNEKGEEENEK